MSDEFIPFHRPSIGEAEIEEVAGVLRAGWLTTGPKTAQFQQEFRAYVAARHTLAVNSCTAGLHLALAALQIGPGDEVITTPLTFCATVNCILHVGATPVLADVAADGNLDPASVSRRITPRTRAILPVHIGGLPCDMASIWKLARDHSLYVIEDAAHAVGAWYGNAPIGASVGDSGASDAVVFSFYATKNLTTGEGGMIATGSEELSDRMRILCLHGISKDAWNRYTESGNWFYDVTAAGFKYNLSDIQSAIGIHQLRRQEDFLARRSRLAALYDEQLSDVAEIECPPRRKDSRHSWHLYASRLNLAELNINRADFIQRLRELRIGTSVHFIPILLHRAYAGIHGVQAARCPMAMELYPRLVSLPIYPALTEEQVRRICAAIKQVVAGAKRRAQFAMGA
ncbi:MAG TPA: DegT/DnrJ/EryC1/StrS family aminotransferase [Bryobacteraceae bacterium]|nr:DegT/DnrJ/EryC1/StrS family aminotransferase [Bryobacteraceae bacterium]